MPKATSTLYNHNARNAFTRQLSISTNPSGRSSYTHVSSQVRLDPVAPEVHCENESYMMGASMDIDEDHVANNYNEDIEQVVEVMLGIHVVTKSKAKRYEISVSTP
jgi:hypothetical protein